MERSGAAAPLGICLLAALAGVSCTRHAQLVNLGSGRVLAGRMHKALAGGCRMEFRGPGGEHLAGICTLEGSPVKVTLHPTDRRLPSPRVSKRFEPLRGAIVLTGGRMALDCGFVVERPSWHGNGSCRDGAGESYRLTF